MTSLAIRLEELMQRLGLSAEIKIKKRAEAAAVLRIVFYAQLIIQIKTVDYVI